ncbi:MAG: hypothetical protein IJY20_08705 [Clostridia bacterium]|nr:hypothetical protein [Clostridia bacterium]
MKRIKRNPLAKLLCARLRCGGKQFFLQAGAVALSMLAVSFFLCLCADLGSLTLGQSVATYRKFINDLISAFRAVSAVLTALAVLSLYLFCRMRREENAQFYATLTSLGATNAQRKTLMLAELSLLYVLPAALGAFVGLLPASLFSNALVACMGIAPSPFPKLPLLLLLMLLAALLSLCFGWVPLPRRQDVIIQEIRRHNREEETEEHHYRRSHTFRRMPVEQRIAKKSVDYYKRPYRRISLMLAAVALYPLLAIVFFASLWGSSITVDANPFDGIDTVATSITVVGNLLLFAMLAFLALCLFGVLQVVYMIRLQKAQRQNALRVYRAVGMTERGVRCVLTYEYRTVAFHAVIYVVFAAAFLFVLFAG